MNLSRKTRTAIASIAILGVVVMGLSLPARKQVPPSLAVAYNVTVPGPPRDESYFYLTNIGSVGIAITDARVLTQANGGWMDQPPTSAPFAVLEGGVRMPRGNLDVGDTRQLIVERPRGKRWKVMVEYWEEPVGIMRYYHRARFAILMKSLSVFSSSTRVYPLKRTTTSDEQEP